MEDSEDYIGSDSYGENFEYKPSEKEIEFKKTELAILVKKLCDGTIKMGCEDAVRLFGKYNEERKKLGLSYAGYPDLSPKQKYELPRIVVPENPIKRYM